MAVSGALAALYGIVIANLIMASGDYRRQGWYFLKS